MCEVRSQTNQLRHSIPQGENKNQSAEETGEVGAKNFLRRNRVSVEGGDDQEEQKQPNGRDFNEEKIWINMDMDSLPEAMKEKLIPLSSPVISRMSENKHPLCQGEEVGFSWGKS